MQHPHGESPGAEPAGPDEVMPEHDSPDVPGPSAGEDAQLVVVTVSRSGGLAGLRRTWRAEPPVNEAPQWIALIDDCPWDEPEQDVRGADRYIWLIDAVTPESERTRRLPDAQLRGPWHTLVAEVRAAGAADAPEEQ